MNKKKILSMGIIASVFAPIVTIVSCGTEKKSTKIRIANIKKYENLKLKDGAKDFKIALITDAGRIDDKSFNQSADEAIEALQSQFKNIKANKIQPLSVDKLGESYKTALKAGYNVWILPGFNHKSHIFQFYKENRAKMSNVFIIGIDFGNTHNIAAKNKKPEIVTIDNMYGLNYNTQEAAFLAGVAAAKYLVLSGDKDPHVGTFGGGDFAGVTKFNHGFLEGVLAYDQEDEENDIQYAGTEIKLDTGFTDPNKFKTATKQLVQARADIILPVAGAATGSVLKDSDKIVIGVDVDQRKSYKDYSRRFLTSIQKGMGQSTYDALVSIFTTKKIVELGTQTKGLDDNWVQINTSSPEKDLYKKAIDYANTNKWKAKAKKHGQGGQWFLKKEMTFSNINDLKTIIAEINKKNGGE